MMAASEGLPMLMTRGAPLAPDWSSHLPVFPTVPAQRALDTFTGT